MCVMCAVCVCVCAVCVCVSHQLSEEGPLSDAAQHGLRVVQHRHHLQDVCVSGSRLHRQSTLAGHTARRSEHTHTHREHIRIHTHTHKNTLHLTCPMAYMQSSGINICKQKHII